jgi:hypothetical protein
MTRFPCIFYIKFSINFRRSYINDDADLFYFVKNHTILMDLSPYN